MANPYRGEVDLEINGACVPMRLTLSALARLENELGAISFSDLVMRFEAQSFKSEDIIAVLQAGYFGAHGRAIDIGNASIGGGAAVAALAAIQLLKLGFDGHDAAH